MSFSQQIHEKKCDGCGEMLPLEKLFQCRHKDCSDNQKLQCEECGVFYHRKRSHSFLTNAEKEDINLKKKQQKQQPMPNVEENAEVNKEEKEEKKPHDVCDHILYYVQNGNSDVNLIFHNKKTK